MKLTATIAVVLAALVAVPACGGNDDDAAPSTGGGAGFETRSAGVLAVGTEFPYPPFEYRENGKATGFDVDLLDAMATKLDLRTDYVNIPFDTLFTALAAGRFDVAAGGFTVCAEPGSGFEEEVAERKRMVVPTDPYYLPQQTLFVSSDGDSSVSGVGDIGDGTRIGVLRGTAWVDYAEEHFASKGAQVVTFQGSPDMVAALQSGNIDAGFDDLAVVQTAQKEGAAIEPTEQVPVPQKYNFAVAKENPGLAKALDRALAQLVEDGTYERLHRKYFPGQELPAPEELREC